MAYLVEQAGGLANTGTQRILDIVPTKIHERCGKASSDSSDLVLQVSSFSVHTLHVSLLSSISRHASNDSMASRFGKGLVECCFHK